jgi:hypothetical protein
VESETWNEEKQKRSTDELAETEEMFPESEAELPPVCSMFARTDANLPLVRGKVVAERL